MRYFLIRFLRATQNKQANKKARKKQDPLKITLKIINMSLKTTEMLGDLFLLYQKEMNFNPLFPELCMALSLIGHVIWIMSLHLTELQFPPL